MPISRYTHRQPRHIIRKSLRRNYPLLFLSVLLVCGAVLGCFTYESMAEGVRNQFQNHMQISIEQRSISDISAALLATFGKILLILFVLFLTGLTPYGVPVLLGMCVCFGFYIGVYNCFAFETSGLLSQLIYVIPTLTLTISAFISACKCSVHISCLFSRQLMPFSAHCGSLWQEFKHYLLRYMVCVIAAFAAAVCDVMIHMIK